MLRQQASPSYLPFAQLTGRVHKQRQWLKAFHTRRSGINQQRCGFPLVLVVLDPHWCDVRHL